MSPEERAKALFPLAFGETLTPYQEALRERIANAIRKAEDAAYERAAAAATRFLVGDPFNGVPLRSPGPHEIAAHILTLKSQEP